MSALQDRILLAALPHVLFDGWSDKALAQGARDLGLDRRQARIAFPGGVREAVLAFSAEGDRRMLAALAERDLSQMRFRDRIAFAVRARFEALAPYREAVRRSLSFLALPPHAPLAMRATYRTVDAVWRAVGDRSTDFNFYTKRALLAAVYGATALYWLSDDSEGSAKTWEFLDRRLDDVMAIPKARGKLRELLSSLPFPLRRPT
jgi:ubiquinone biosynthesis protein COQ9